MPQAVRIDPATHSVLAQIAEVRHESMTEVVALAVEQYRRTMFMKAFSDGYARLRSDPKAWAKELAERELWDTTNGDGLEGA